MQMTLSINKLYEGFLQFFLPKTIKINTCLNNIQNLKIYDLCKTQNFLPFDAKFFFFLLLFIRLYLVFTQIVNKTKIQIPTTIIFFNELFCSKIFIIITF